MSIFESPKMQLSSNLALLALQCAYFDIDIRVFPISYEYKLQIQLKDVYWLQLRSQKLSQY